MSLFRRFISVLCFMVFMVVVSGCDLIPDVTDVIDVPGFEAGEDISEDITHNLTVTYDLATYTLYTSTVDYESTQAQFEAYLEGEGYEEADEDDIDRAFFIQYGDGTKAGGTVYETDDYYLYVYMTIGDDGGSIYTVGTSKENYEGYMEGELDEGQIDDDADQDIVPDDDVVEGEELPGFDVMKGLSW